MASITRQSNGRKTIQFVAADGKRRSIRLGKVPQKEAEGVRVRVEHLNAAAISGYAVDDDTARWLRAIGDVLADKLARAGLAGQREVAKLGPFIAAYVASRDVKTTTVTVYGHTRRCLVEFFGAEKLLREITPGGRGRMAALVVERAKSSGKHRSSALRHCEAILRRGSEEAGDS